MGQPGFFDLDKRLEAISAKGDPLEALKTLIPFEGFRAEIEAVVRLAPEAFWMSFAGLRQQLLVLQRRKPRPSLKDADRRKITSCSGPL